MVHTPAYVVADKMVIIMAQSGQPVRKGKDHFRGMEAISGFKFPGEEGVVDSHHRADTVHLVFFDLRLKSAGVGKHHSIAVSMIFSCLMIA